MLTITSEIPHEEPLSPGHHPQAGMLMLPGEVSRRVPRIHGGASCLNLATTAR